MGEADVSNSGVIFRLVVLQPKQLCDCISCYLERMVRKKGPREEEGGRGDRKNSLLLTCEAGDDGGFEKYRELFSFCSAF